jgi:hypothetical protein
VACLPGGRETCAVTSLEPEPVKVGDVAGQPAQRRGLLQGAVRVGCAGPAGVTEILLTAVVAPTVTGR